MDKYKLVLGVYLCRRYDESPVCDNILQQSARDPQAPFHLNISLPSKDASPGCIPFQQGSKYVRIAIDSSSQTVVLLFIVLPNLEILPE